MPEVYSLYIDDSGTRAPDHVRAVDDRNQWFALGGILFRDADKEQIERAHKDFYARWPVLGDYVRAPLHSNEIRMGKAQFAFLNKNKDDRKRFLDDLGAVMTGLPVLAHACVIDRAGYRDRYHDRYKGEKWRYCRTAFTVLVERAAKFVHSRGARLRIAVEETDKETDGLIEAYHQALWDEGMPFTLEASEKYAPFERDKFRATLYGLSMKTKKSRVMQFADIFLYPLCKAGYAEYVTYVSMLEAGRIIDCEVGEELSVLGVKYSCFDKTPPHCRTRSI